MNKNFLFQAIVPVMGIVAGLIAIFFPKKLTELQIKMVSKSDDFLNTQIKNGLSRPQQPFIAVFVGMFMVVICFSILWDYLR